VEEMRKMFVAEANKYQVFPLDASVAARVVTPPEFRRGIMRDV
jgi:arylsulfatase